MKRLLTLITSLFVVASCSLSGGIGGTGSISGFGSIWVNGTEWFIEAAEITLDGVPAGEEDLRLGMLVTFEGHAFAPDGTAVATRVAFDDAVQGPIASLVATSPDSKTATILGQTVVIGRTTTRFDDSDASLAFETLALDDVLEVSGHVDGDGTIYATWLRRLGGLVLGATAVEVEGVISGLAGSVSFALGSVSVEITPATDLDSLESLENGVAAEVEGILTAPLTIVASRVSTLEGLPVELGGLSLEGIVTDFVDIADFRVVGQRVDATNAEFEPADPSLLGPGMLIQVEGRLAEGVVIAESVRFVQDEVEIRASLALTSDVDPGAGQLTLLGISVSLAESASVTDERDGVTPFGLANLSGGDFLEVRGVAGPLSGLVATELHRTEVDNLLLRGPVSGVDATSLDLSVLGVPVELDEETSVTGSISEFLSTLWIGRMVEVVDEIDSDSSELDVATEIEVED